MLKSKYKEHMWPSNLFLLLSLSPACLAQCPTYNLTGPSFDYDPILQLQPEFARSLPVQILLTGVVLTLVGVLLIHLIFTAQYHWPLAPVNYILQVSGVSTLLISLVATLRVILSTAMLDSKQWPYMLTYIAVNVPPQPDDSDSSVSWDTPEFVAWYVMIATVSCLVQITHIQFLTLLYPSRLEARLILFLLVPLAIVSAAMELFPVHQNQRVQDVAEVIRNTCNATLSLLFTTALFIWGFLVNRKQAWRTDGGTAAFGAGALLLTIVSTALSFLYIPAKDKYVWLPGLMWAVILWQNFLGWWWWVGGGMGVGEVDELLRREEKRQKKRKARLAKRIERKEKAQLLWKSASETLRRTSNTVLPVRRISSNIIPTSNNSDNGIFEEASQQNAPTTETLYTRLQTFKPVKVARRWYDILRHSHLVAARVQALHRVQRRQEVFGADSAAVTNGGDGALGWGLGSFGVRERERQVEQIERDNQESFFDSARQEDTPSGHSPTTSTSLKPPVLRDSRTIQDSDSITWWGPFRRWRLQDSTTY